MPHLSYKQFILMPEIVVIAHLTCKKSIGTLSDSIRKEESTCTST